MENLPARTETNRREMDRTWRCPTVKTSTYGAPRSATYHPHIVGGLYLHCKYFGANSAADRTLHYNEAPFPPLTPGPHLENPFMARSFPCCAYFLLVTCLAAPYRTPVWAGDWPTYAGHATRNHATSDALPNQLLLQWQYQSPQPPRSAWPNSKRLDFDRTFHPVIADGKVLFGSSADDTVTALDLQTGRVAWQFTADGPVRFAPACWQDRAFVASDDGYLYALALADGRLLWKHAASPDRQLVLGNGRLISRWAARGGPVVFGNTVYYAAGIWPSDGVFVHALECQTGEVVWSQTDLGTLEMDQPPGGARAESGIAPQGYLLADEEHLY
ncbi:MAG TPA: hypothetical protein ENJ50_03705, partial [Planctomycetaceae bacterium]|nr:hypothetical protein [Planctomycetaceae bacterium]